MAPAIINWTNKVSISLIKVKMDSRRSFRVFITSNLRKGRVKSSQLLLRCHLTGTYNIWVISEGTILFRFRSQTHSKTRKEIAHRIAMSIKCNKLIVNFNLFSPNLMIVRRNHPQRKNPDILMLSLRISLKVRYSNLKTVSTVVS